MSRQSRSSSISSLGDLDSSSSAIGISNGEPSSGTLLSASSSPRPNYRPRRTTTHSAMVQAMITSNNLRNCREVEDMVAQCMLRSDKQSFMCNTARQYFAGCKDGSVL